MASSTVTGRPSMDTGTPFSKPTITSSGVFQFSVGSWV
jgi:hypothetical protein